MFALFARVNFVKAPGARLLAARNELTLAEKFHSLMATELQHFFFVGFMNLA